METIVTTLPREETTISHVYAGQLLYNNHLREPAAGIYPER
ncbi:hypothetical protein [Neobacillus cucumis]|nr:hypothetical protein [Neobacillus cucumis]